MHRRAPVRPVSPLRHQAVGRPAAAREPAALQRRHARRAAPPRLGPARDVGGRRGAAHGRARHLHRAAVARGVDPAGGGTRRHRARRRRPADASTCTSRAGAAGRRWRARSKPNGASAACSRSRACCARWRSNSTPRPTAAAPLTADARQRERRLSALFVDELRRAPPGGARVSTCRTTSACARCAKRCSRTRRCTPRSTAGPLIPAPARAPWRACSAASSAPRSCSGASRCCWPARSSLAARKMPMAAIAAELGYASPSAFSAMVRRSMGAPPSRFFAS